MSTIKSLLFIRFKIIILLTTSMVLSMVLLMIRMKLTHSLFYLFLVWNLFLAVIPFAITIYLVSLPKLNIIACVFWFCAWLLFLPNAPYIITDLLHLKVSTTHLLWLDILVVLSFAFNGLLLFFLSLTDMNALLNRFISHKKANYIMVSILFLCGFGVYLGRFLRYNSWEIFKNPWDLFTDIANMVLYPNHHADAWLFTILFGTFLSVGFWVFKTVSNK